MMGLPTASMYRPTPAIPYTSSDTIFKDRFIAKFAQPTGGAIDQRFEAARPPCFAPFDQSAPSCEKEIAP